MYLNHSESKSHFTEHIRKKNPAVEDLELARMWNEDSTLYITQPVTLKYTEAPVTEVTFP